MIYYIIICPIKSLNVLAHFTSQQQILKNRNSLQNLKISGEILYLLKRYAVSKLQNGIVQFTEYRLQGNVINHLIHLYSKSTNNFYKNSCKRQKRKKCVKQLGKISWHSASKRRKTFFDIYSFLQRRLIVLTFYFLKNI